MFKSEDVFVVMGPFQGYIVAMAFLFSFGNSTLHTFSCAFPSDI